jgi:hypothetical protein
VEYMEALGPDGDYGRWLRSKPIAVVIDETIFVHGGLSVDTDASSVADLVTRGQDELARFDRYRQHLIDRGVVLPFSTFDEIFSAVAFELNAWVVRLFPGPPDPNEPPPTLTADDRRHLDVLFDLQEVGDWSLIDSDGPLWFRGFAQWSEEEGQAAITTVLERLAVVRAVVGHTPTTDRRITARFDSRVFLIDTGMLAEVYQGRPSALELVGGRVTAIYLDEPDPVVLGG